MCISIMYMLVNSCMCVDCCVLNENFFPALASARPPASFFQVHLPSIPG